MTGKPIKDQEIIPAETGTVNDPFNLWQKSPVCNDIVTFNVDSIPLICGQIQT